MRRRVPVCDSVWQHGSIVCFGVIKKYEKHVLRWAREKAEIERNEPPHPGPLPQGRRGRRKREKKIETTATDAGGAHGVTRPT